MNSVATEAPYPERYGEASKETGKIYQITINQMENGYAVVVGCKSFVFETKDSMLKRIDQYLSDPDAVQKKFFEKTLFKES